MTDGSDFLRLCSHHFLFHFVFRYPGENFAETCVSDQFMSLVIRATCSPLLLTDFFQLWRFQLDQRQTVQRVLSSTQFAQLKTVFSVWRRRSILCQCADLFKEKHQRLHALRYVRSFRIVVVFVCIGLVCAMNVDPPPPPPTPLHPHSFHKSLNFAP